MHSEAKKAARAGYQSQRGQCAKRLSILEAAAKVFCQAGFSGASIDEIAAAACVSRQTVYNHYGEKETLFIAVVDDVMERADSALFSILSSFPDTPDDLEDQLTAFAVRLNRNCLCNQDGRFLRKLVQSEGARYPHLFETWRQNGPGKIAGALAALLARLSHKAAFRIDDFDLAARQFLALINADLQMSTLFGAALSDAQLETSARDAVRTFLRAYGPVDAAENTQSRPAALNAV